MNTIKHIAFFSRNKKHIHGKKVSIDVVYQEKYNEMRRHRDWQLSTANWCTIILLAIIAGFVSLGNDAAKSMTQLGPCGYLLFKSLIILFIWGIVVFGSKIVIHSAKRYKHLRDWVSENMEPTINGIKYEPEDPEDPIQDVIITVLVFLAFLVSGIVVVLYNPSNLLLCII